MRKNAWIAAAGALALAGCATTGSADTSGDNGDNRFAAKTEAEGPFPSTYRAYPGTPTALVGATVFDGTGKRIENGVVLLRDGKVVAVGDSDMSTAGYT